VISLINHFRELQGENFRLLVAGSCRDPGLKKNIEIIAGGDSRIALKLEFVPEDKAQIYFRASDLVVLPFVSITNSGSAMLALSFGIPTVVPNIGSMSELAAYVGSDWISTYDGELSVDVLKERVVWAETTPRPSHPSLDDLEWDRIAFLTAQFYEEVLASR
jgi:glycosyltransferase involved in cell wall biosynthesis